MVFKEAKEEEEEDEGSRLRMIGECALKEKRGEEASEDECM